MANLIKINKQLLYSLSGVIFIIVFVYGVLGTYIINKENNSKYLEIINEVHSLHRLDGNFINMKNNFSTYGYFTWLATRVDLERSNKEWEADAKGLLIKNGWKPHPNDVNSLCKNGIKTTFETIPYQGKDYEIVTMLYDTVTKSKEECNYPHNEFLNWLR